MASNVYVEPLGDRVLVQVIEDPEVTESGIHIPDQAREKPQRGEVIAVGPGRWEAGAPVLDGDLYGFVPVAGGRIAVGDVVLFSKYAGTEVPGLGVGGPMDRASQLVIREADLLGVERTEPLPVGEAAEPYGREQPESWDADEYERLYPGKVPMPEPGDPMSDPEHEGAHCVELWLRDGQEPVSVGDRIRTRPDQPEGAEVLGVLGMVSEERQRVVMGADGPRDWVLITGPGRGVEQKPSRTPEGALPMPDTGADTPYTLITLEHAEAEGFTASGRVQEQRGDHVYDLSSQTYWPVPEPGTKRAEGAQ